MASLEQRVDELERKAGAGEPRILVFEAQMTEAEIKAMIELDREESGHLGDYILVNTGVPRPEARTPHRGAGGEK